MTDENETNEKNIYEQTLVNDGDAIEAYLHNIYRKSVPEPQPPTKQELSFWKIAGIESSLFVLSAVGAAVLSAIRTGGLFYILEVKLIEKFKLNSILGNSLGGLSMITALLAFEGFLIAYGLTKGKESGKIQVSKTGMTVSIATIIMAGIFSSFSIVSVTDDFQMFMNILLALITGSASAIVAFYSSENLGFILNHVTARKNEILLNHQNAYMAWHGEAVNTYLNSTYNIRHKRSSKIYGNEGNRTPINQDLESDVKSSDWRKVRAKLTKEQLKEIAHLTPDQMKQLANQKGVTYRTIDNWRVYARKELGLEDEIKMMNTLSDFIQQNSRFPSADEIKSMNISALDTMRFIVENQEYLSNNNLLDQGTINTAIEKLNSQ